ncbi:hypothetical protein DYB26_010685, partial [Aphanomyces astaci]
MIREDKILTSPNKKYLSVNAFNPQRVCEPCHHILLPDQAILRTFRAAPDTTHHFTSACVGETASNAVQPNSINEAGSKRFLNSPYSFTLREEVRKAAYSIKNFMLDGVIKDQSIPLPLLTNAQGIAFLTVLKVGFVVTGRLGTGLVLSKLPDGSWYFNICHVHVMMASHRSAPSAIATAGIGWGAQIGGEVTDFVIILNTRGAVDTFCAQGQVNLGAELGVAAGPVGRVAAGAVEAGQMNMSYISIGNVLFGLFIGISLEGSVVMARPDVNREFYGKDITAAELLGGRERPPVAAQPLYDALEAVATRYTPLLSRLTLHLMLGRCSPANGLNRLAAVSAARYSMSHSIKARMWVDLCNGHRYFEQLTHRDNFFRSTTASFLSLDMASPAEGLHLMVPKHILQNVVEGTKSLLSEKRLLQQRLDEAGGRIFALERQLADQQMRTEVAMQSAAKAPASNASHKFKNLTLQVMKTKRSVGDGRDGALSPTSDHMRKDEEIYKLRGKTNELETLIAATRAITHQTAHREVVSSTLNAARNLVSARMYSLALTNEGNSSMLLYSMGVLSLAAAGEDRHSYNDVATPQTGTVFDALQATATGMFESQMDDFDFVPHSVLCMPIRNAHGTILVVTQRQHSDEYMQNQVFTTLDKDRFIWNLRLSKERQTAQTRIEILLRLNRSIAVESNSAAVLEKIMDVSYELLRCERVSLFVKIQGESDLFVAHANDATRGQYISIDKGIAGLVARTGQVVTTNNVDEHPCFDRELDERTGNSTKKLLCVPVKDPDGTILAVVQAVNKVDKSDFSIEDTLFLNYIAEAAGISLHKSYLHNEVIIAKRLTDVRLKLSDYVLNHNDIHSLTDLIMVHGKAIMV